MKSGCEGESKRSISLPVIPGNKGDKTAIGHSHASRWRAVSLIAVYLLMAAHVIQWRLTGSTVSPIEPSESMFTLETGAINAGFIFFGLAILSTLIFGRFVCGWICHIVALQDFCAWLMKKAGITPKPFRSRLLVYVPLIVALYMFVWPTAIRALTKPKDVPLFPGFTNHLITSDFWVTFPSVWVAIPFLFICGFLAVYFLGAKGFCTYGCPYGAFFGIADKAAPGRIRVTDACNQCGHCTATCTSNVLVHAEVKQFGMVVDPGCMKCMDCISVCPNDALYFGFGKPQAGTGKKISKTFSLTWPEEIAAAIVCALSYFAVWGVYQLVPMLMAVGIAIVTTFLAVISWRLLGKREQSFHKFSLVHSGKIKTAGWIFLGFSGIWIGLILHSGWIRYHERGGAEAFQNLQIPDELALAQKNPDQWLSPTDRANLVAGRSHFDLTNRYGLFSNEEAMPKVAWFEFLAGNAERSVELLGQAATQQSGQPKAMSLYYAGSISNRLGKFNEAIGFLDQALQERSDLIVAREEKGESLWQLGKRQDAADEWVEAIQRNPKLPLSTSFLAGAAKTRGDAESEAEFERQANAATVDDPYFHWMLGLRLRNVGMAELAERHFRRAIQLDPAFRARQAKEALSIPATK